MTVSDTPSATLTGLILGQTYYARVKAINGGDESAWSSKVTFRPVLTIGSGTTTDQYLPTNSRANYALSQQIYTAAEIDMGGTITSIALYNNSTTLSRKFDIYLVHTDKTSFSSNSDWITVSASDKVFSGNVTMTSGVWTTITLNTPFAYNGTSNLALIVDDNTGSTPAVMTWRVYTATGKALYKYADDTNYDPTNPPVGEGSVVNYKNQIRLGFTSVTIPPKPSSLTATDITTETAILTWSGGSGHYNVEKKMEGEEEWTRIADNTTETSMLIGVDENAEYQARVQSVNPDDENLVSSWRTTTFHTAVKFPVPTGLGALISPGDGTVASLSWTENGTAYGWELEYGTDPEFNVISRRFNVYYQPKQLTGLTPGQTYYFRVRSVCDEGYSRWSSACAFTPTPTDAYAFTINGGTTTNDLVPIYGKWVDELTRSQFTIEAADLSTIVGATIDNMTFYPSLSSVDFGTATFDVYMGEVSQTDYADATLVDWTTLENVYSGSVTISDNKMEIAFDEPYQYMGGNLLVGFKQTTEGSYKTTTWYGVEATGAAVGGYNTRLSIQNFLPKTTFEFTPAGGCIRPFNVRTGTLIYDENTVTYGDTISWTSDASAWNLRYKQKEAENWTTVAVTGSTSYVLTGLSPSATYEVQVQANCGSGSTSAWTKSITFTTGVPYPAPKDMAVSKIGPHTAEVSWSSLASACEVEYTKGRGSEWYFYGDETFIKGLYSGGDSFSWGIMIPAGDYDGDKLTHVKVYDNDAMDATLTIYNDGDTEPSSQIASESVTFAGAGEYMDIDLSALNLTIDTSKNVWITFTGTGYAPVSTNVYDDANARWIEAGNGWTDLKNYSTSFKTYAWMIEAYFDGCSPVTWTSASTSATSPFTLTGLDAESLYTVRVKALYKGNHSSDPTTTQFKTTEEHPVPYDIEVATTETTATISWTGFSDTYKLRYKRLPSDNVLSTTFSDDFEDGMDNWLIRRNGDGTYYTDWRQFDPTIFTDVDYHAHSGDYVAISRSWSSNAYHVDNWLISPKIPLDGYLSYWAFDSGKYHEHYDIYVNTNDTILNNFTKIYEPGDASNHWSKHYVDLSSYNGAEGYFAFRLTDYDQSFLFIDDLHVGELEVTPGTDWMEVNTTDCSVTLTGLMTDVEYEFQIVGMKNGYDNVETDVAWFTITTPGNVNGDNKVDFADVEILANIVVGKITNYDFDVADVNGDGKVSVADVTALVNYIKALP